MGAGAAVAARIGVGDGARVAGTGVAGTGVAGTDVEVGAGAAVGTEVGGLTTGWVDTNGCVAVMIGVEVGVAGAFVAVAGAARFSGGTFSNPSRRLAGTSGGWYCV